MEIDLTPEQVDFVRLALSVGRIDGPAQAVGEAMPLWVERERRRIDLVASLDCADASILAGKAIALALPAMHDLTCAVADHCRIRQDKNSISAT